MYIIFSFTYYFKTICKSIKFARLKNILDKSSNFFYKNTTFVFLKSIFVNINGIAAELKRASSHNNILNYAKKAIFKQNAKIVLFEFVEMSGGIWNELNKMKRIGIKVKYFTSSDKIIFDL